MTITDATFELTKCGAVENGFAVVEGKKVSVMRIWEYCECLCDYYVDTVIVNDMCEAPKAEEKKEEKKISSVMTTTRTTTLLRLWRLRSAPRLRRRRLRRRPTRRSRSP